MYGAGKHARAYIYKQGTVQYHKGYRPLWQQRPRIRDREPLAAMIGVRHAREGALVEAVRGDVVSCFVKNERGLAAVDDAIAFGPGPHGFAILEMGAQGFHDGIDAVARGAAGKDSGAVGMVYGSECLRIVITERFHIHALRT